jgi:hypothetical protein
MATPSYKGANQPSPNGGGWLGSWLGGTPGYKSAEKRPGAAATTSTDVAVTSVDACGGPIAIVIPREVIEQQ